MIDFFLKINPMYYIFLGGLISLFGTALAAMKANRSSADYKGKVETIQSTISETNKQITGGDSYPFFDVAFSKENNSIFLNTYNYGDVKLENVTMEIWDSSRISALDPRKPDYYSKMKRFVTTKTFAVLYPNNSVQENEFKIDKKFDDINLSVDFKFGNRHLIQSIWIYNYKNINLRHGEVKVVENNKVLIHFTTDKDYKRTYLVNLKI